MGLILRDGIWMKEIAASNADIASQLLDLSRKKLKDGSKLWNNFIQVI
jgi:cytochrome c-type biogenesis protein CcmH/NrfF